MRAEILLVVPALRRRGGRLKWHKGGSPEKKGSRGQQEGKQKRGAFTLTKKASTVTDRFDKCSRVKRRIDVVSPVRRQERRCLSVAHEKVSLEAPLVRCYCTKIKREGSGKGEEEQRIPLGGGFLTDLILKAAAARR